MTSEEVDQLLPFAETYAERDTLEFIKEYGSVRQAAMRRGKTRATLQKQVRQVKQRAARKGFSPKHDYCHPQPEGFRVKGVSSLYGDDGNLKLQWVKSQVDTEQQEALIAAAANAMAKDLEPLPPIELVKRDAVKELLNLYVITDAHLGMLSWKKETGDDWNLDIAVDTVQNSMGMLMKCSPPAESCVIAQIGDFFHSDSMKALTPEGGHVLDQDSRFSKIVEAGVELLRRIVEEALARYKNVHLIIGEGNHDPVSSIFLRVMFGKLYEKQKRLTVEDTELPYYAVEHGETLLGFHHGHKKGVDGKSGADLALLFAQTPAWGRTKHRYVHTGHLHSEKVTEVTGCHLQQHSTIAAPDAYSARGGWRSKRAMRSICYHKEFGEVGGVRVTPEMLG